MPTQTFAAHGVYGLSAITASGSEPEVGVVQRCPGSCRKI